MTQQHHDDLNDRLKQVGLYNEHNLAANRIGNLSKSQYIRADTERERHTWGVWVGVFLSIVLVWTVIISANYPSKVTQSVLLQALGCSTVIILGGWVTYKTGHRPIITQDSVTAVEGAVKKQSVLEDNGYQKITRYYIEIDETSFPISEEIFAAFVEGQPYIIYYVHTSMTLVAAEYIPPQT